MNDKDKHKMNLKDFKSEEALRVNDNKTKQK